MSSINELPKGYSDNVRHWWKTAMKRYAEHQIEHVASPCGTLKRWSCKKPNEFAYSFQVVQSNSTLLICGDIGDLVIGRGRGTINWLLGSYGSLGYVSEKVEAGNIDEYCEMTARKHIESRLKERDDDETDIDDLAYDTEAEFYQTMIELGDDEPTSARDFTCQFVHCVAAGVWLADKVLNTTDEVTHD